MAGPSQLATHSSIGSNQRVFTGYLEALKAKPVLARLLPQGAAGRGSKGDSAKNLSGQVSDSYPKLLSLHVGYDCPTPRG